MGFVVHESHVLCVLTNGVALLTANHSSPVHSLSDPEERCRGTVLSFVSFSLASLHVHFTNTLSLFCYIFFLHLSTQQMFQRISLSSGQPRPQWSLHGSFLKAGLRTNARWVCVCFDINCNNILKYPILKFRTHFNLFLWNWKWLGFFCLIFSFTYFSALIHLQIILISNIPIPSLM